MAGATAQAGYYEQRAESVCRQWRRAHQRWRQATQDGLRAANEYLNHKVRMDSTALLRADTSPLLPLEAALFGTLEPLAPLDADADAEPEHRGGGEPPQPVLPPTDEEALALRSAELYVRMSELMPALQGVMTLLAEAVMQMTAAAEAFQGLVDQAWLSMGDAFLDLPVFNRSSLASFATGSATLLGCFQTELLLRQTVVEHLSLVGDRQRQLVFLSAWLEEPYVRPVKHLLDLFPPLPGSR